MRVPFLDLTAQYTSIKSEIDTAIQSVLDDGYFVGGLKVSEFEARFAAKCNSRYCIGTGNATDGLFIALKALGVTPGNEVITPAWSWISSAEVISLAGATPVFADVDPEYFTLSKKEIEGRLSPKTKAIIVVHLYGQMADLAPIKELCRHHNLALIEDCAQAHLAELQGKKAGTEGDCGVFSFFPTKNLGAYGDGGCLITDNQPLSERIRRWANHGGLTKDEHLFEGINSRLDTLQAAILTAKLPHLVEWNRKRSEHASLYRQQLGHLNELILPSIRPGANHTFHQFVIQANKRDKLKQHLEANGIQTMIHYPKALPFEPAYKHLNLSENNFPIASRLQNTVLSLPVYPELTPGQIDYVCEQIIKFYGQH